jgi:RNA polymerase sigma factor (sigma-70 family)
MSQSIKTLNITLLRNNKDEFIVRCQKIVVIIVKQYIAKRMFTAENFEDIVQDVNIELIKRLPLIEKNYNGKVRLISYLNVVIHNICLRLYGKESSNFFTPVTFGNVLLISGENADDGILIANELERFKMAIKLFHSEQFKILVCLKVYFSIPISSMDLRQCFRGITMNDHFHLMREYEQQLPAEKDSSNFNVLTSMLNKYEQTEVAEDTVRHWTNEIIQKLINLMNGNPPNRAHTKDSLKFLLEHYSELHTDGN